MKGDEKDLIESKNTDALELEIEELEEMSAPVSWICVCSTTCKCTSCSCAAWSL